MKKCILIVTILILSKVSYSQEFNKSIDKDSLFQVILQDIPIEKRLGFRSAYEEGNEETKEFLLVMFSMPKSSKKELIDNYENKSKRIVRLKKRYLKFVPDSLIVSVEFNPENKIFSSRESIDLMILRKETNGRSSMISQEWNLDWGSEKLSEMLTQIGWDQNTLVQIKELLGAANCVSIKNGAQTSIGFARSGMGKYFYLIFDDNLLGNEIEEFNDDCMYIFYKDKVVLEYGSGAIGSECFPD